MARKRSRQNTPPADAPERDDISLRRDGSVTWVLLDGVESSAVDEADPTHLAFEYMQHMDVALDVARPRPAKVRALHLGGAGCALPWAWAVERPGSRQVVAEIDAEVARLAREWFDLPRSPELRIRVGDALDVLRKTRPASQDVVVRDAFADGAVPAHLQTRQFFQSALEALDSDGLFLANCAHGGPYDARPDIAGMRAAFGDVTLIADPKVRRSARRGNIVALAQPKGAAPLDRPDLERALRRLPLPARLMEPSELGKWLAGAKPLEAQSPVQASGEPSESGDASSDPSDSGA